MARVKFPETYEDWATLLTNISNKHKADGEKSVLLPCLKKYTIDLAKDEKTMAKANTLNTQAKTLAEQSESKNKERDAIFTPLFKTFRSIVQFLKKLNLDNPRKLSEWSLKIDKTSEIVYPTEFAEKAALIEKFIAKHNELGDNSPLNTYLQENEIDPDTLLTQTKAAKDAHAAAAKLSQNAEQATAERDTVFEPVQKNIRTIGAYLKGLYDTKPQKLSDWGFEIDRSPRNPQERTATIAPNTSKIIRGIKLNSQFSNTGEVPLQCENHNSSRSNKTLPAGESFKITRGWGTITVTNKDKKLAGEVSYVTVNTGN